MEALDAISGNEFEEANGRREFWQRKLYEWGFPGWFRDDAKQADFDWTQFLPLLQRGQYISPSAKGEMPQILCDTQVSRLCAAAISEIDDSDIKHNLLSSLRADGKTIDVIELEQGISAHKERSRLERDLLRSVFPNREVIARHLRTAEELLRDPDKAHPCINEVRSAFEAVVSDGAAIVTQKVTRRPGSGVANELEFFCREGLLTQDEQQAFCAAWKFLCAGSHPGIPTAEQDRISFILAIEFIQVLRIKLENASALVKP